MVEYKHHILIDGQINTFEQLAEYLSMDWELRPGDYSSLGTENMRVIRLVRYTDEERLAEGLDNYKGVIQIVKSLIPSTEDLDTQKDFIGNKIRQGWEIFDTNTKIKDAYAVLILRERADPPVAPSNVEEPLTEEQQAAPEIDKKVYIPATEQANPDELEIRTGTGELVETIDASPEAVKAAQEKLDLEAKDIPVAEIVEEKIEYARELLGCDDCQNDDTCSLTKRRVYTENVYEFTGIKGVDRPQKCPEFKEAVAE